jgi:hypothetical protein
LGVEGLLGGGAGGVKRGFCELSDFFRARFCEAVYGEDLLA